MKYATYGIFLGCVLTMLIFMDYAFFSHVDKEVVMPYVFISMLLYFFLIGFYVGNRTCSFREGLRAGMTTGAITMLIVSAAYFLAHNVFFYDIAVVEPDKLEGFERSGLLSIHRYLIYNNIRFGVIALVVGSLFAAFCAAGGSFTACHLHKSPNSMRYDA